MARYTTRCEKFSKVCLSEGQPRCEATSRHDRIRLACLECGRVEEFPSQLLDDLKRAIAMETGTDIRMSRLEIGGRCQICCSGPDANKPSKPARPDPLRVMTSRSREAEK
jgi:hypothetical protein